MPVSQAEGERRTDVDHLMADGLQAFREGRNDEAARTFRQAADLSPKNEFAWIWVAQTSTDPAAQRLALERALVANPDSKYANDALRRLNNNFGAQTTAETPVVQPSVNPVIGSDEKVGSRPSGRVRLQSDEPPSPVAPVTPPPPDLRNAPPPQYDDIRATLVPTKTAPAKGGKQANRRGNTARSVAQTRGRANQKMRRGRGNGLLIFLLALLLIVMLGGILALLYNFLPSTNVADVPTATAVATPEAVATSTAAVSPTDAAVALPTNTALPTATPAPPTTPVPTSTLAPAIAANTASAAQSARNAQVAQLYSAAQSLSVQGKDAGAAAQLEQALALDRSNATLTYQLGLTYLRLARSASTTTTPAATIAQTGTPATSAAATTPTTSPAATVPNPAALDKAVDAFRRVTLLRPNWPGGFTQLAQALIVRGDLPAAITALQDSLKLDPNGADRWLLLADLYDRTNRPTEAVYARSRAGVATATPAVTAAPTP